MSEGIVILGGGIGGVAAANALRKRVEGVAREADPLALAVNGADRRRDIVAIAQGRRA